MKNLIEYKFGKYGNIYFVNRFLKWTVLVEYTEFPKPKIRFDVTIDNNTIRIKNDIDFFFNLKTAEVPYL
jgi:hypothetical protein